MKQFLSNPLKSMYLMCAGVTLSFSLFFFQGHALGETVNEVSQEAAENDFAANFEYAVRDGGVTITKYKGSEEYVVVPSQIAGMPVRAIGAEAFRLDRGPAAVTIPAGVTTAGLLAFFDCTSSPEYSRTLLLKRNFSRPELVLAGTVSAERTN